MLRSAPRLFRCSPAAFVNTKSSTGLTGVPVVPNARNILKDLYEKVIEKSNELPEDLPYRIDLQNIINHRLQIIKEEEDCAVIEERINYDQVENLIHQARNELHNCLPAMLEAKIWEVPGWKTKQIPIVIREIGESGPMDLSEFGNEDTITHTKRTEIVKEQEKAQKKE